MRPLIEAGHDLTIFASGLFGRNQKIFELHRFDNVAYYETSYSHFDQSKVIGEEIRGRRFDAAGGRQAMHEAVQIVIGRARVETHKSNGPASADAGRVALVRPEDQSYQVLPIARWV